MGDSDEEFRTPAHTPFVRQEQKDRERLLNPPVLDFSAASSPGQGDLTIRPVSASPLDLPRASPQLAAGWPPGRSAALDLPLSGPASLAVSTQDLAQALSNVTRTRRAAAAAGIDVDLTTAAMADLNTARRTRDLEHGRLKKIVETLENSVNSLILKPSDTLFTEVGVGLEDLKAAAEKVFQAQDAVVEATRSAYLAENPEADEDELAEAAKAADEFTFRVRKELRDIKTGAYRALDEEKKSNPALQGPAQGLGHGLPGGAGWAAGQPTGHDAPVPALSTSTVAATHAADQEADGRGAAGGGGRQDQEDHQDDVTLADPAVRHAPPHTAAGGGGGGGGGGDDGDDDDDGRGRRGGRFGGRYNFPNSPEPSEPEEDKQLALFRRMVEGLEARVEAARNERDTYATALSRALVDERRSVVELQQKTVQALRQPRLECGTFSGGDEQDFIAWRTGFKQMYPSSMEPRERFLGLRLKTSGAARELLSSLQVVDSSYEEAMARLEAKYGTPAQVIARMNRSFKAEAAVTKTHDAKALRTMFEKIRTMVFTYRQLGEPMAGSYLIGTWLEKLPHKVRSDWVKATLDDDLVVEDVLDESGNVLLAGNGKTKKGGNVDAFLEVLNRAVRMAEGIMELAPFKDKGDKDKDKKGDAGKSGKKGGASNSALLASGEAAGGAKPKTGGGKGGGGAAAPKKKASKGKQESQPYTGKICPDCQEDKAGHKMTDCQWFKKLNPSERRQVAWDLSRCKRCLDKGHFSKNCTTTGVCKAQGCRNPTKHHPLLHKD